MNQAENDFTGTFTFHGCGMNGERAVVLRDASGELHVFDIADVTKNQKLMDSLSPRANFLLGICWNECIAFRGEPKAERLTAAASGTLQ